MITNKLKHKMFINEKYETVDAFVRKCEELKVFHSEYTNDNGDYVIFYYPPMLYWVGSSVSDAMNEEIKSLHWATKEEAQLFVDGLNVAYNLWRHPADKNIKEIYYVSARGYDI